MLYILPPCKYFSKEKNKRLLLKREFILCSFPDLAQHLIYFRLRNSENCPWKEEFLDLMPLLGLLDFVPARSDFGIYEGDVLMSAHAP